MLVSIVTVAFNSGKTIRKTIESVLNQTCSDIEYLIIDGKSSDNTVEIAKEYVDKFAEKNISYRIVSEKDKGIYDAINKGLKLATGDYIGLCFDQFAAKDVISKMVAIMEKEGTDGVHGDLDYVDGEKIVRKWRNGQGDIRKGWMPGHPTLYLKKEVYEMYGLYKTDYRISADYEYMIRILKDGKVKLSYIPEVLIKMSHGGTSTNSLGAYLEGLKEGHRALKENGVKFAFVTDLLRTLRVLKQFIA